MNILVITGTGTGVGKTMVTAACAALAVDSGQRVAVVKPAQTGVGPQEPGDLDEVARFAGKITTRELRRYPEPLAPDTAAARAGMPQVHPGRSPRPSPSWPPSTTWCWSRARAACSSASTTRARRWPTWPGRSTPSC